MKPDAFEQLVSEWLDDRENAELRRRIDAAMADDASLARLLDEWERFDAVLRANAPEAGGVDWTHQQALVGEAVNDAARDDRLDTLLDSLPGVDGRVDWDRLASRISGRVHTERRPNHRWRRAGGIFAGVAVAAAVGLFAILPYATTPTAGPPVANLSVLAPPAAEKNSGVVIVQITRENISEPQPPRYFAVDPVVVDAPTDEFVGLY